MIPTRNNWVDDDGVVIKTRVRNWRNYDPFIDSPPEQMEDTGEFPVVPGMTLSMKQVLDRHQRGVQLPGNMSFFDEEIPDMSKMDKMDVIDMMRETSQIIDDHQKGVAKRKSEKAKADELAQAAEMQRLRDFEANHKTDSKPQ